MVGLAPRVQAVALRAARRTARRAFGLPESTLRRLVTAPPRNDQGIELDVSTHALLTLMRRARLDRLHHLAPDRARRHFDRNGPLLDLPPAAGVTIEDRALAGADGPLPCRVYRPAPALVGDQPLPVLLWLHGGGFVIGSLETHVGLCSLLAARARCLVVAVEYRKAPEHRFPAAVDDALAALRSLRAQDGAWAREGADLNRLAIGGDSAGGNLSAVVCQQLREAGEAQPSLQVLIYPATDMRRQTASHQAFARDFFLTRDMLDWFMGHYLGDPDDMLDPRASPLLAARVDGLAPALIRTCGFDPLRDEAHAYAERLREAMGPAAVELRCHDRLVHGFVSMGGALPAARQALLELGDDLHRALRR